MSGPDPAVAAVRLAVRRALANQDGLVLVACSGGPDSLALAAAAAFEARSARWRAGVVVVDHGLLEGSGEVADTTAAKCRDLGLAPVNVVALALGPGPNVEARAREARYSAVAQIAQQRGATAVLLGHTMEDQAETVLLALGRGSGVAALAGMPARRGLLIRPLLGVRRAQTEAACAAQSLAPWRDPTNTPGGPHTSRRAEVRAEVIPAMEAVLGPGLIPALARSAAAVRADAEYLDSVAATVFAEACPKDSLSGIVLDCELLASKPAPIRRRALYLAALAWGAEATEMGSTHVNALDALVVDWRGQGMVALPGCRWVVRECGKLTSRPQGPGNMPRDIRPRLSRATAPER